jgi:transcriptional regulator with XRE-family HTH domain
LRNLSTQEIIVPRNTLVKSVGKAIAAKRKLANMTQVQVADRLGIEKETVSRLETGVIPPSLARLEQLADIFDCTVRHFFWHESGDERTQADAIADMIRSLPESRRAMVVRFVVDVVRVLAVRD